MDAPLHKISLSEFCAGVLELASVDLRSALHDIFQGMDSGTEAVTG
jgi:hypothetical protein